MAALNHNFSRLSEEPVITVATSTTATTTTTTLRTTTTTTLKPTTEVKILTIPKDNKIFEGCGSSKACFGMPVGCIDAGKLAHFMTLINN
jgi:hypothetical protein